MQMTRFRYYTWSAYDMDKKVKLLEKNRETKPVADRSPV